VDSLVLDQIARGAFPGAQLLVQRHGKILHARNFGKLTYQPLSPLVTSETMYDLASVSKVVATTTAAMKLFDEGRLALDAKVAEYLPEFAQNGKKDVTIRNLLLHNSGLPAFRLFYRFCKNDAEVVDSVMATRLEYPTGSKTIYSDLGMITLAKVIERITGSTLDEYARREFFEPLGMTHTMYNPPDLLKPYTAPTENDTYWRMRVVQGAVHDETAAMLNGVAGHAGLFSTASDLAIFAQMLLDGGEHDGRRFIKQSTIEMFTHRQERGSSRGLGWDSPSSTGSSAGRYFSARSFGHTGFTGTSIWIDPDADMFVIFLTNRVYPTRENKKLISFRPVLHDAVRRAMSGK
jgi:CubicO group peptidase (beta-lactamase class C family)